MLPLQPTLRIEPALSTDRIDPALASDRIEPALASERMLPALNADRIEPALANDPIEPTLPRDWSDDERGASGECTRRLSHVTGVRHSASPPRRLRRETDTEQNTSWLTPSRH